MKAIILAVALIAQGASASTISRVWHDDLFPIDMLGQGHGDYVSSLVLRRPVGFGAGARGVFFENGAVRMEQRMDRSDPHCKLIFHERPQDTGFFPAGRSFTIIDADFDAAHRSALITLSDAVVSHLECWELPVGVLDQVGLGNTAFDDDMGAGRVRDLRRILGWRNAYLSLTTTVSAGTRAL